MQWRLWHIIIININTNIETKYHTTFIIMRLCAQNFLIAPAIHSNGEKFPCDTMTFCHKCNFIGHVFVVYVIFLFICWLLLWLEDTHHTVYYPQYLIRMWCFFLSFFSFSRLNRNDACVTYERLRPKTGHIFV